MGDRVCGGRRTKYQAGIERAGVLLENQLQREVYQSVFDIFRGVHGGDGDVLLHYGTVSSF